VLFGFVMGILYSVQNCVHAHLLLLVLHYQVNSNFEITLIRFDTKTNN